MRRRSFLKMLGGAAAALLGRSTATRAAAPKALPRFEGGLVTKVPSSPVDLKGGEVVLPNAWWIQKGDLVTFEDGRVRPIRSLTDAPAMGVAMEDAHKGELCKIQVAGARMVLITEA